MMIAVFISNDAKIRLFKEAINKIDPNVVIYEEEKDIIDEIYNNYKNNA